MGTTVFWQTAFRIRNDNGSETTATWRQDQGTNDTIGKDLNFRVRFLIDEQNGAAWTNRTLNLYYSKNGAAYAAVTGSTPVFFSPSSNFTDGDDTTSQLTGGSGGFLADNNGMKEATGGAVNSGAKNDYFELEWCLQLDEAQLANNDYIDLRVYDSTSALGSYTATPRITYSSSQTVEETASAAAQKGVTTTNVLTAENTQTYNRTDGITATHDAMTFEYSISLSRAVDIAITGGMVIEETLYDFQE